MSLAQTHPELAIVCRILQQASIAIPTPTQFDRLWSSHYLQQCFQWTHHLSSLLLSGSRPADVIDANPIRSENEQNSEPLDAVQVVISFLDALKEHRPLKGTAYSSLTDISVTLPSQEELLNPSAALILRLLRNPGLSDQARIEILSHRHTQAPLRPRDGSVGEEVLAMVNENALEELVMGMRSHFLKLQEVDSALIQGTSLSKDALDRMTKARIILRQMQDPSRPISADTTVERLRQYMEASRSEALQVINRLSDMVATAMLDPESQVDDGGQVDWKVFTERLAQLKE